MGIEITSEGVGLLGKFFVAGGAARRASLRMCNEIGEGEAASATCSGCSSSLEPPDQESLPISFVSERLVFCIWAYSEEERSFGIN